MSRRFAIFLGLALPLVLLFAAACGGDDDDDDSGGDDDDSGDSADSGRTDASNATGTLTIAGKDYKIDMETCVINDGQAKLTVLAGTLSGGELKEFSASGIEKTVAIAVTDGADKGYISAGAELKIDGKAISFEGDVYDPAAPGKPVKLKFSTKC